MRPSLIIVLSSTVPLLLIQLAMVLFGLYRFVVLAAGAGFFTAAVIVLGSWAAYDHTVWPFRTQAPRQWLAVTIGLAIGLMTALGTAQLLSAQSILAGTMIISLASVLGAYLGQRIGNQLRNISL